MSRLAQIRKQSSLMQGLIPTPYNQCKAQGEETFSSKNNRKQMDWVCSIFPKSGFYNVYSEWGDKHIATLTTGRCEGEFGSYNAKRCNDGVMFAIRDQITVERNKDLDIQRQILFDKEQLATQVALAEAEAEAERLAQLAALEFKASQEIKNIDVGLPGVTQTDPPKTGAGSTTGGLGDIPVWMYAVAAGGAFYVYNQNRPKRKKTKR